MYLMRLCTRIAHRNYALQTVCRVQYPFMTVKKYLRVYL